MNPVAAHAQKTADKISRWIRAESGRTFKKVRQNMNQNSTDTKNSAWVTELAKQLVSLGMIVRGKHPTADQEAVAELTRITAEAAETRMAELERSRVAFRDLYAWASTELEACEAIQAEVLEVLERCKPFVRPRIAHTSVAEVLMCDLDTLLAKLKADT